MSSNASMNLFGGSYPAIAFYAAAMGIVAIITVVAVVVMNSRKRGQRIQTMQGAQISAAKFLADWKTTYRNIDKPGCYVILVNPTPKDNGDVAYDSVYVGKSIHVYQQVKRHLSGQGNSNVFADVRDGKNVVVQIVPCKEDELGAKKKALVDAFKATSSYNKRRG